jgi:hypothetical protein
VVGLNRELEWRSGAIIPRQRAVIPFPVVANTGAAMPRSPHPAPVINIRLETRTEARAWKWIGVAAVLGAVAFTSVADVTRQAQPRQRADLFRGYRSFLQLGPDDDYASTVRKLGVPARIGSNEINSSEIGSRRTGARVFRLLAYPSRRYSVVLMGSNERDARYIGALDSRGRVLDAVRLRDGSSAESLLNAAGLRSLPSF